MVFLEIYDESSESMHLINASHIVKMAKSFIDYGQTVMGTLITLTDEKIVVSSRKLEEIRESLNSKGEIKIATLAI